MASPLTYEAAEVLLTARLSPTAADHSRRVAETAGLLATRYGVDVDSARLAGLLHDWDREQSSEQLIAAATSAAIEVSSADVTVPYLLHARTGASALRATFPDVSDEIVSAVAHHTVGSVEMSDLDRVVYIADMIEPGRDYPGVQALRELATSAGLAELFASAYQQSILYLISSRKRIHPDTVSVWNALVAGDQP